MMQWHWEIETMQRAHGFKVVVFSVRATLLKIPKRASCGLYKNSGSDGDEIDGGGS